MRPKRHIVFKLLLGAALLLLGVALALWNPFAWQPPRLITKHLPTPITRPYGMAPVAFNAFLRACKHTGTHPYRIGQTIGDHPRSVGYHKRDGVLTVSGQRIDYTAAVDIGAFGLDRKGIDFLLHNLTKQGFACWFREGGKWKGNEHIHAVYASLPMKRQLRKQVREFLRERRARGIRPLPWERKATKRLNR